MVTYLSTEFSVLDHQPINRPVGFVHQSQCLDLQLLAARLLLAQ